MIIDLLLDLLYIKEPEIEFEAESQLEGRPIQQLTNLIINQVLHSRLVFLMNVWDALILS